jgi:UDP-N-acetylmuramate--alanine ligase
LVGIGGSGLSAIARILLERGYEVSGSDRTLSPLALDLAKAGVRVFAGHAAEQVSGADLVVRSSAVPDQNPEVLEARRLGIPVMKRQEFLELLLQGLSCIAVAGTHGKTTTTAMIAWMMCALEQDPSFLIGGVSANLGVNARAGKGAHFVIEADEYDGMFLGLQPQIAVITNIEHDHPDCYPTSESYLEAFAHFIRRLQPRGLLVASAEDPGVSDLLKVLSQSPGVRIKTYSLENLDIQASETGALETLVYGVHLSLQVPGIHNLRNALAALEVASELGLPLQQAAGALGVFRGTGRRFELRGEPAGVTVIDDYAHHPTEIRATLAAARLRYPGRRIWVVWQPHTYSRTRLLFQEFATAFEYADFVLVTDIYAARESQPQDGFSASQVARAIAARASGEVFYLPALPQAQEFLIERLAPGDVLLVLSAGDADSISNAIISHFQRTSSRL